MTAKPDQEKPAEHWGKVIVSVEGEAIYSHQVQILTDEQVLEKAIRHWFPGYKDDQDQVHR